MQSGNQDEKKEQFESTTEDRQTTMQSQSLDFRYALAHSMHQRAREIHQEIKKICDDLIELYHSNISDAVIQLLVQANENVNELQLSDLLGLGSLAVFDDSKHEARLPKIIMTDTSSNSTAGLKVFLDKYPELQPFIFVGANEYHLTVNSDNKHLLQSMIQDLITLAKQQLVANPQQSFIAIGGFFKPAIMPPVAKTPELEMVFEQQQRRTKTMSRYVDE